MLFNNQGYEPVHYSQDDRVILSRIIDQYTNRLIELKLAVKVRGIPSLEISQCMADNSHAIEIQPDGGFCRCEHENIHDSYGNLFDGIVDLQKPVLWKEKIERSEYCPECNVYPACYLLRRCMNADNPCIESMRLDNKKKHEEVLLSIYLKSLEDEKDERVHGA